MGSYLDMTVGDVRKSIQT